MRLKKKEVDDLMVGIFMHHISTDGFQVWWDWNEKNVAVSARLHGRKMLTQAMEQLGFDMPKLT